LESVSWAGEPALASFAQACALVSAVTIQRRAGFQNAWLARVLDMTV